MKAIEVLEVARVAGLSLRVEKQSLLVAPITRLDRPMRNLLTLHRAEVVALLTDAHATTQALLAGAPLPRGRRSPIF
ncbi:hypothetical protein [Variovorax ginsengisoli]|uniref:TubC N-terminal docking domain-containing protein n=1 Tax=Variovorax ginsengisoli TaxID=363844 RepID=A0ABT8S6W6_9BURK|nr:hypothetical protein [Variovorax ginsengisoli]MDN8615487.1 hypothetical protein [Variovorax ginsengisoli]MDO1534657.1 hypothetical protein [Variovorax ginsengisoli]